MKVSFLVVGPSVNCGWVVCVESGNAIRRGSLYKVDSGPSTLIVVCG